MATGRLTMTVCKVKVKVNHVVMSREDKSRGETNRRGRGRDDTRGGILSDIDGNLQVNCEGVGGLIMTGLWRKLIT